TAARDSEFYDAKGRLIRCGSAKQWRRDIVNRHTGGRPCVSRPVVGVSVKNSVDPKTIDRLFQTTRSEEGKNFWIFALYRCSNRRIMEHDNFFLGLQLGQCLLEPHRMIDCLLD